MLTRRHIRAKVMQSVYAFVQSGNDRIDIEQKNMLKSIDDIFDLYLLLLDLVVEVVDWDNNLLDKRKSRLSRPDDELLPNQKFASNKFVAKLAANTVLQQYLEDRRIGWKNHDEYLQILLKEIKESDLYAKHIAKDSPRFKSDKNFIIDVYREIIAPNEKLHEFLESESLSWIADLAVANSMVVKSLTLIFEDSEDDQHLMSLYKDNEDKQFAIDLFNKTILNSDKSKKLISDKTPGWDADRIAQLDLILMEMGVSEFLYFPSIPTKVTINEYLEISKDFSTPKSRVFINGVLDKLWRDLDAEGVINKSGRGLV
ncbi:MAG: transcription antitermination factor NusB [Flavobacteriales bacterium]|nr:transcription antitermination factor NusB [Flavobacteriales bacterium]